jgi:uncharacterized protein YjaG (DUF416 family)
LNNKDVFDFEKYIKINSEGFCQSNKLIFINMTKEFLNLLANKLKLKNFKIDIETHKESSEIIFNCDKFSLRMTQGILDSFVCVFNENYFYYKYQDLHNVEKFIGFLRKL